MEPNPEVRDRQDDESNVVTARPPRGAVRPARPIPEFPGCQPVRITREDIETYEGRYEFWDAATETAWMVREPTGATHETPSHLLAALVRFIAAVRGSPITCLGSMDLELRDAQGRRRRIMQADQSLYLHPRSALAPEEGMVVGEHDFPDVVLEVDHITDVRSGKLWLYEEWGFPEVWVEVPERYTRSRPAGRRPGLAIHLLEDGVYREALVSRALPGWTAGEIHAALNEAEMSQATGDALNRVGRALGEREGTGPDDMPWLRGHRREGEARGRAQGLEKGHARGRAEGFEESIERLRRLLRRQAAQRFGAGTAERLSGVLARIDDPERLSELGEWLVDCATGPELLARMDPAPAEEDHSGA